MKKVHSLIIIALLSLFACEENPETPNQTGSLEGYVFEANTNITISDAKINAGNISTLTDSNGFYRLENLPAGKNIINAEKEFFEDYSDQISIVPFTKNLMDINFTPIPTIKGIIKDLETGLPVKGVLVTITDSSAYSDSNGYYAVSHLPIGPSQLVAELDNYYPYESRVFISFSPLTLNFRMKSKLSKVYGIVTNKETSEVLFGAEIRIADKTGISDNQGYYEVLNVEKGDQFISVEKNGYYKFEKDLIIDSMYMNYDIQLNKRNEEDLFQFVEGGTFQMGKNEGEENQAPSHTVTVSSFYISKYEVTQLEWELAMGYNNSYFTGDFFPVINVSWFEAIAFCNTLSRINGRENFYIIDGENVTMNWSANGYRLPTEAEWEFAARGGNGSNGYEFSGSNNLSDVGWFIENSSLTINDVGSLEPNELGLYDMSGNASEWVNDWYGLYSGDPVIDPSGPDEGTYGIVRGGSWSSTNDECSVYFRTSRKKNIKFNRNGFRVIKPSL